MSDLYSIQCQNCGAVRADDVKTKCPKCGSRQTSMLGYVYEHEAKSFQLMLAIVAVVLLLFLGMGCVYLYYIKIILGV